MKPCSKCNQRTAINKSNQCEVCTLKTASVSHFGCVEQWENLGKKYVKQNGICPWTKLRIVLGTDASVDHDVPKSKGGSKSLENINWVHKWFNIIASNSDKVEFYKEFKRFIYNVYHNLKLDEEFGPNNIAR